MNKSDDLIIANKEIAFQKKEKEKCIAQFVIANKEIAFQKKEKEKCIAQLVIANKELAFQNEEKQKRAAELIIANKELVFQNEEKEKRAAELITSAKVHFTQRKKDEEYIGHLAAIVESSDDAIISKTLNGTIKSWNKGAEKMFGYTANEAIDKHITLIIPPEYNNEVKTIIEAIQNNESIEHYETVRTKKSGEQFYVSLSVSPLKDRAGSIIGCSKIARDISSRKKSEAELIRTNKELAFQNDEKEKWATELSVANEELAFQIEEKEQRAAELIFANKKGVELEELLRNNLKEMSDYKYALDESAIIAITDQKGIIKKVNNNFCLISKYSEEELIGQDHRIINSGYHPKEFIRNLWLTVANGKIWRGELKNKAKDGTCYWVDNTIVPFLNENGKPYQYLAIRADITTRKETEESLIQRTAQLETANKKLVFQHEEKEKRAEELVIANNELAFQNDEKEKRAEELSIANKELAYQNHEKEKRAAELSVANIELAYQNDEKEKRAGELSIANIELAFQNEGKEKRASELVILSGDLKAQKVELKRANDDLEKRVFERTCELESLNHELKDLSVSKDKFLSVISHDLRNPLTALLLASDQLNSHSENNTFDPIQPFIKIIHRTSHNILQQLNELVDWAKMQQEKTTPNPEKIHLVSAVDQSFELLKSNAIQKNIFFENKVPLDIYVNADAIMLRSILQNLVTNSIKYSLKGGLVIVTAQRIDKLAEICVIDSGIGMEADTRENLFTKTKSPLVSGTNNEKGSGLGLILVKDFVIQHGGTLRVESEIEKGTCIFFTIPEY